MDIRKQRDSIPMMDKIIVTGLLIETNDRLEGTLFDRYYCRITDNVGKRFMNAQYKIYQKEYNDLLTSRFNDVSFLTENLNRGVKILSKAMRTDTVETFEIIEEMQSDPVLQKRISGIYKKHKKQSNAKTRNDEQN